MATEEEKLKAQQEKQVEAPSDQPKPEQGQETAPAPTATPEESQVPTQGTEETPAPVEQQPVKTFTQDEVNSMLGKTRQEARQRAREEYAEEIRSKYGLDDDNQLDSLVGDGQRFDALNQQYGDEAKKVSDLESENALLKSGVPAERFNDVKAILAYGKMEVTPENIQSAMATHPEWKGAVAETAPTTTQSPASAKPVPSVITKVGGEPNAQTQSSEEEKKHVMQDVFGR